jgi:NAD+ synthase
MDNTNITEMWGFDAKTATQKIIKDIRKWFNKNFPNGNAVVGISGGKDSTVTAALLCKAIGSDRVIGVLLPNGEQTDIKDSIRVCTTLGIKNTQINIRPLFDITKYHTNYFIDIPEQAETNLAPRIRMTVLFFIAQCNNAVVVNTGNYSEYMLGWFTFGSDTCGSYAPILDYTCTEVIEIGKELGLPLDLIEKTPSDGLCGSTDEEKFGFTYADCDMYLRCAHSLEGKVSAETIKKIETMIHNSEFKRTPLPFSSYYVYNFDEPEDSSLDASLDASITL